MLNMDTASEGHELANEETQQEKGDKSVNQSDVFNNTLHIEESKDGIPSVNQVSEDLSNVPHPQITVTTVSTPTSDRRDSLKQPIDAPTARKSYTSDGEAKNRCPIYFGINSYLHNFYDPPDKDVVNSGEYIQEDDFEFVIEPGKRRWQGCWFRTGLWIGINLLLLGAIALLVGHLTPARNTIVGHHDNLEILDRSAIAFNRRLEVCRLSGLVIFCCGGVVTMITLLISSYQQPTYYVMGATVFPEMFVGKPLPTDLGQIPITESVRSVQPTMLRH